MSDRGVSEVIGFVLVFALVTGTIGVVYGTGIVALHDAQHAEKVNNVERAFDVLADSLEDVHRMGAPSRATEVKLAGGSIGTGDIVKIQIDAVEDGDPNNNASYAINLEPIVYRDDRGTELLYSGGAVIRSESSGAVMLTEPSWIDGPNRSVMPLVNTYGKGSSISGEGTVLIVAQSGTRKLYEPFEASPGETALVNVTVTSPRAEVWKRYFEDQGYEPVDPNLDHGNVTYRFETETLYTPKTGIEISFNR